MKQKRTTPLLFKLLGMIGLLLFSGLVNAGNELFSPSRETPKAIAQASQDQACVEPIDVMRRQHMEFIKHQRDKTMYKGIRTTKHSLLECINCHVTYDDQQQPVSSQDSRHFCRSCHQFAAVSLDCFQCHNSKPTTSIVKPISGHPDFIMPSPLNADMSAEKTAGGSQP